MMNKLEYKIVDGIKCYHLDLAEDYGGYPSAGFDITDEVKQDSFWVTSRSRLFQKEVSKSLSGILNAKLFEIGCGTGDFLNSLSSDNNIQLLGSEIYLKGLKLAKAKYSNVEFVQLDGVRIPFINEFDVICAK